MTATDFRIERILLPTDFSEFSNQALRHALALARKFKARLKVVYVIPQVYVSGEAAFIGAAWLITPEIRRQAEEEARRAGVGARLSGATLAAPGRFYRFFSGITTFDFAPPAMAATILLPTSSAAAFSGSAARWA